MKDHQANESAPRPAQGPTDGPTARRPYTPPHLERLGNWSTLTLQQSIPVGPGNW